MALDPISLGVLAAGGGSLLGALLGSDAQNDANDSNQQLGTEDLRMRRDLLTSGSIDPYGNLINVKDGSGPFKTILTGDTKKLADTGLANAVSSEKARGEAGGIRDSLIAAFREGAPSPRTPLTLEGARGVVNADDDKLKNAILNPALSDAAAIDQRTLGGTSNAGNITSRFQQRLLPQIKLGGETKALELANKDRSRFTEETLGLGEGLNKIAAGGFQPEIPGVANLNAISQASNAIPKPTPVQPDVMGGNLGAAAVTAGNLAMQYGQMEQNNALTKALTDRLLKNQLNA